MEQPEEPPAPPGASGGDHATESHRQSSKVPLLPTACLHAHAAAAAGNYTWDACGACGRARLPEAGQWPAQ